MEYKGNIWVTILTLLVGIAMIFMHKVTAEVVAAILGGLFIAIGCMTAFVQYNRRDASGKRKLSFTDIVTAVASLILGLWIIGSPSDGIIVITRLAGVGLFIAGGFQLYCMLIKWRGVTFAQWLYAGPVLVLGCGIFMIAMPKAFVRVLLLITGIAMLIYSLSALMQMFALMSFEKHARQRVSSMPNQYNPSVGGRGEYNYVEEVSSTEVKPRGSIGSGHDNESGPWPSDRR